MTPEPSEFAKGLRHKPSDAERLLWQELKSRQLGGIKFRRQQQIGDYIVDFVSFEKNLVIELDGGQHKKKRDRDERRDDWLSTQGFSVLRFWNEDVMNGMEEVLESIKKNLIENRK